MRTSLFLLALCVTGCASGWTRELYSHAQFQQDRFDCDKEALVAHAGVYVRVFNDCMYAKGYRLTRGFFWQFSH